MTYPSNRTCFQFKGDRQDSMTSTKCRMQWRDQLASRITSLILNEESQEKLELPRVVCEYAKLPGLPPTREVDFSIELQPGTTQYPWPHIAWHQQNYEN